MSASLSCAALAVVLALGRTRDDVGEALARLASARVQEREAAERWLSARLAPEDYPELAKAALTGDAEVRLRLARVLSADSRHLSLALLLCSEQDLALTALGREAVHASVARFDPELGETALRGEAVERVLRQLASKSSPRILRLDARQTLEQWVEELELCADLPVGITVDARFATRAIRRPEDSLVEPLIGPWDELLLSVARSVGLTLECYGLAPGRTIENAQGGFLRLVSESDPASTGVEVVSAWLRALTAGSDEIVRAHAARNLASSGFSPALEWMDQLVRTRNDRAAREGLLRAAARDRVAPVLLESPTFEALLAELDAPGVAPSAPALRALARSGCFAPDGSSLVPRLLAGYEGASARGRWARLLWFEHNACAAPEAVERARATLAEASAPGALRLQALYTLVALAGGTRIEAPRIAGLLELLREPQDEVGVEHLGRALRLCGVEPPAPDPARLPADWSLSERLNLLQVWLWSEQLEPVAAHLAALFDVPPGGLIARGDALAEALQPWLLRGRSERLRAVLQRTRALVPARALELDRLALQLGLVPAKDVPALLARAVRTLSGAGADWALVGALAGYPEPIEVEGAARETLQAALNQALHENRRFDACGELLGALERAVRGLYAAGRDSAGDEFSGRVRQALRKAPKTELAQRQPWPPALGGERLDLARELKRFERPASL